MKRSSFTLDEKEYLLEKNILAYEWRNSGGPAMAVLPFLLLNKRATKNIILGFLVRRLSIHIMVVKHIVLKRKGGMLNV